MRSALIGYTGFVGGNLIKQVPFDDLYNSSNINQITGKKYDMVICAGARAEKWKINQEPEKDLANIKVLMNVLRQSSIKKMILISTIDVYPNAFDVTETSKFNPRKSTPYGYHRYMLEKFCLDNFDTLVIRLPGLFGTGIKKNIIFDFLNDNNINQINSEGIFQFYDLGQIWVDIEKALENNLNLINFATEPISVKEIAKRVFNIDFNNVPKGNKSVRYNFKTKYFRLYDGQNGYIYSKDQIIDQLVEFVHSYQ